MDYKGYDDEEELENPWNTEGTKRVKRIFKIILYSISFIVYAAVFFVIFSSCEPGMFDKMFFTEKTRQYARQNPDSIKVYKLQPKDFMNDDGSIELANIYYAKNTEELEVGVKFNFKKLTSGKVEGALVYILADSNGNFYTSVSEVYDSNRKYGYARVTFGSVKIDLTQNVYFKYTEISDYASYKKAKSNLNLTASEGDENTQDNGVAYYLYIYNYDSFIRKDYVSADENGNLRIDFAALQEDKNAALSKHEIYNNNTVISLEKYQYDD